MHTLLKRFPELNELKSEIEQARDLIIASYENKGKLLVCGNGGSAADSEHITGELLKGFLKKRPLPQLEKDVLTKLDPENGAYIANNLQCSLPAFSLVNMVSLSTAFANDQAPDLVFAQITHGVGLKGDILIAISTSGNSKNVLYAITTAKARGMKIIGLTGKSGGAMKKHCDVCINVPSDSTPDIQELHLPVYHYLCASVEERFFPE